MLWPLDFVSTASLLNSQSMLMVSNSGVSHYPIWHLIHPPPMQPIPNKFSSVFNTWNGFCFPDGDLLDLVPNILSSFPDVASLMFIQLESTLIDPQGMGGLCAKMWNIHTILGR